MLGAWTEILPLFVVRWLALRYCERVPMQRQGHARIVVTARPGIYIREGGDHGNA
jgi:hypothetical protein